MTILELKNHLSKLIGYVTFEYNGYSCGVDALGLNSFDMWYGDNEMTVESVEDVLDTKFFDGRSLTEIWNDVTELDY